MDNRDNILKSRIITRMTICVDLAVTMIFSPVHAKISGSWHDFTYWGAPDKCSTCHVPHKPLLNVPLWAHALTTSTFYLYNANPNYSGPNSSAYDSSPTDLGSGKSRLCLSCHDGTIAAITNITMGDITGIEYYITYISNRWILWNNGVKVGGGAGGDLSQGLKGSHPIAVNYNMVRMNQPGNYNDIGSDPDVKLDGDKVQCTTCHNPHNKFPKMLVKSNAGSAICFTCHNK